MRNYTTIFKAAVIVLLFLVPIAKGQSSSENADAYLSSGEQKFNKGDYKGAISDYTLAIKLSPNNPAFYNNRGIANYFKGDYKGAISDYTKAIELDQKNPEFYINRGNAYFSKGDKKMARKDFLQALDFDSNFTGSVYRAGKDGVEVPRVISKTKPAYTDEARKHKIRGSVMLGAIFQKDGAIGNIKILRSLGYGLDEEAIKAAKFIQFVPGKKDGQPADILAVLEFTFEI